jgi:hypothetical protein
MTELPSQKGEVQQPPTVTHPTNTDSCIGQSPDESRTRVMPDGRSVKQLLHARYEHLSIKETAEPQSKKDDNEAHNKKLVMGNHDLKAQVEKLSQQVEDLQLRRSDTSATRKKRVRFSDDSVSPVQVLREGLPSMSASDLEDLRQGILRELVKRVHSDQNSPTTTTGNVQSLSQATGDEHMTNPVSPTPPHTPKSPSLVHDNGQPGIQTKTSGYMKGTTASDTSSRSWPNSAVDGLMKQPNTRTPTRPATHKTSGRRASGTREQPYTGDCRRSTHIVSEDLPRTRFNTAAATSKKER